MDQPTEDRIKRLEEEQRQLKEEVRKLREQITEPIKIDRLEIDRGGTQELLKEANKKLERIIQTQTDRSEKFDRLEHGQREISKKQDELKGELESLSRRQSEYDKGLISHSRSISKLQDEMAGARADIANFRATQADHGELLKNAATKDDVKVIRDDMGELKQMLAQLLNRRGE